MASIIPNKNKMNEIISYRIMVCVGRDEQYKEVWRTKTIKRPKGLTPAREHKEVERIADAWELEQKAAYQLGTVCENKEKITLVKFIDEHWWPDHVKDGTHKPETIEYNRHMSNKIKEYFGPRKKLAAITTEDCKRFQKWLSTTAKKKDGTLYSKRSISSYFSTLSSILEYARRLHYIPYNPVNDLMQRDKPQKPKQKIEFMNPDDARRFMQCLEQEPLFWRTFMNVLLATGMRRGECVGLQWGDIDTDKKEICIQRNVTLDKESKTKLHVGSTKTENIRRVAVSDRLLLLLDQHKRAMEEIIRGSLLPTAFVFSRPENPYKPIYPTVPTRWQSRFVKRHHLPNMSPHDLRHTAATLALESGANLKEVQELLGHSDPSTTMKFYAGVTDEAKRRTVDGIERLLTSQQAT